ncbi:MAG: hypothetical protein ACQ9MH_20140 [Nitrospinales bacterium]
MSLIIKSAVDGMQHAAVCCNAQQFTRKTGRDKYNGDLLPAWKRQPDWSAPHHPVAR